MKHTNDTAAVWNGMLARAQGPPQNPRTNSCTRAVAGVGVAARVLRVAGACSAAVLASLQPPRPHAVALDEWRLSSRNSAAKIKRPAALRMPHLRSPQPPTDSTDSGAARPPGFDGSSAIRAQPDPVSGELASRWPGLGVCAPTDSLQVAPSRRAQAMMPGT